ncbi:putative chromatin regulator PHD family [Helianthus anomalus]
MTISTLEIDHFSHEHSLSLVHLQPPNHRNESSEDEDEEKEDFVEELCHGGQCGICKERIWSFHLCYYYCKSCDYSLHTFCAQLPKTKQNCPSNPGHTLTYHYDDSDDDSDDDYDDTIAECFVCKLECRKIGFYFCDDCAYCIDVICDTMSEQKIKHPSHPHRMFGHIASVCLTCGNKHEGVFFQCTTCLKFRINLDCALLPTKLLIQTSTSGTFNHSHPLTLAYSFPMDEIIAKYKPVCRVCNRKFHIHLWNYKCDKCLYYVHVDCATSKREPLSTTLVLFDKQTSLGRKMVSLHDPMKRVRLLCNGCVRPIMTMPFYTCCQYADERCCFVLHEWCANLPSQIQDYAWHPEHPLVLFQKIPSKFFCVFNCEVCGLRSNVWMHNM